ncbi:hypothetical protein B566_EDAN010396 [Ephemera danica]|nr:hypothetical protein B566_EDAN010396 [Ephemera danica]
MSRRVLNQHVAQSNLDAAHEELANWAEFCAAHQTTADLLRSAMHQTRQPLSYQLLGRVFEKLVRPLQNGQFNDEEVFLYWESTKKILPALMTYIRNIHKLSLTDEMSLEDLTALLRVNQMLLEISKMEGGTDDVAKFKRITNIVTKLHTNLQAATKCYDKIFQEELDVPYAKITYGIFYKMLRDLTEASVVETCKNLKQLTFDVQSTEPSINADVALGTQLFKLYRVLQQFAEFGADLGVEEPAAEARYHTWFSKAVCHWLDVAICIAKVQIQSAVSLDRMRPQDSVAKHSTSAPDIIITFGREICQCTLFYAEQMCRRVQALSHVDEGCKTSVVTLEWCTMINNMEYMATELNTFLLGLINELPGNSDHLHDKLTLAVDEAMDNVMNKTAELLDNSAEEIGKTLLKFVTTCAEDRSNASSDRLNFYMNTIIRVMKDHLKEEHGSKKLVQVWQKLIRTDLPGFIDVSLQSRKPCHHFVNTLRTTYQLENFFSCTYTEMQQEDVTDAENSCIKLLSNMKTSLRLHSLETPQLVHEYHLTSALNEGQQSHKESLLCLMLKDCNMVSLRKTEVVGEAFVKLSSIVNKADVSELENYHELGVLKYRRQGDPIAKQFLKKEEENCSKS